MLTFKKEEMGSHVGMTRARHSTGLFFVKPLIVKSLALIFTVKPHPACPIRVADYPSLSMTVTMEPIAKLLAKCDVAYTSAVTSAAVDAYCAGVPIVSLLDPNMLNLSPLRGCAGALFTSTPEELAAALTSEVTSSRKTGDQHNFFTIDPELPRWRKLIMDSFT